MAADGFTIAQYIELLRVWHMEITKKEQLLKNGFRVYQTLFFILTALTNAINVASTFLASIMIGYASSGDATLVTVISSVITGLGILMGTVNAFNFVFKPQFTAGGALTSSNHYGGLAKELIIEIKSYEVMFSGMSQEEVSRFSTPNIGVHSRSIPALPIEMDVLHVDEPDVDRYIDFETYKNRLLYYATREQIINVCEPGLILIGYLGNKTIFDRTYVSSMPVKDLEYILAYVDTMDNSREKRKLKKIVTRTMIRQGQFEELVGKN